jgi:hypothetical protein
MAAVSDMESKSAVPAKNKIFDLEFAMNVLACSLPFSVLLILGIYSSGEFFIHPTSSFISGGVCLIIAASPLLAKARFFKLYKSKVRQVLKGI